MSDDGSFSGDEFTPPAAYLAATDDEPEPPVATITGEWDGPVVTAVVVGGALAGLVSTGLVLLAVTQIDISAAKDVVPDTSWVDGSFGQRGLLIGALVALWLASLLLIAAIGLAVIETRAAMKRVVTVDPGAGGTRSLDAGVAKEILEGAGKLVEGMTKARGTVVLAISGLVLAAFATYSLGSLVSADGGGTPADGSTSTSDPGDGSSSTGDG